ncbi:MAG: insulinase family protein [Candidatus Adiutrix sp.]|jgi:zinc protease|nr:insulinase family protein [Candidatus Adiutrix sp.]
MKFFQFAGTLMVLGGLLQPVRAWGATEESFRLRNGLKVILAEQPGSPVVSLRVLINTGSADEAGRPEYGLSHLMEHMAFKGGRRYPEGTATALVERNGGEINAYTSNDSTVYYLSLPSERAALGLDILADLVFAPLYDPKEYRLEKEVVVEEIKRGRDNPDRVLMEEFFEAAYPDHPYGRPVIGYEDTVRQATVAVAKAFHQKHYRPDNAVLLVTGGFDRAALAGPIEEFFGGLAPPKKNLPPRPAAALTAIGGPVVRLIKSEKAALAKIALGFRGPAGGAPETPALDLLSAVLAEGKASRLTESVKDDQALVTDISAFNHTPHGPGLFIITAETEPEKAAPATAAILRELARLTSEPPAGDELARIRALAEKNFVLGQESASGLAAQLTEFESLYGDYRLRDAYLPIWNRLGAPELAAGAARLFRPEDLTLVIMLPGQGEVDFTAKSLAGLAREALTSRQASAEIKTTPAFQEMRLSAGPKLLVMRDATLPLVTARAAALGGILAETEAQNGLSHFMTSVWARATEERTAPALARAAEDIGASITAFSGRNSVGLNASFLSTHFKEGLALWAEVLTRPAFAPEEVEKVRPEILAQIKARDEHLAGRLLRLQARHLYPGGHPYSRDQLGTLKSAAAFQPGDLKDFYTRLVRPDQIILAVAGDVDPDQVRNEMEKLLAGWRPAGTGRAVTIPGPPEPLADPAPVTETLDRAQTHLALGFQVPGLGSPEGPALDVLAAYLSGMSGPLFRELRDQQSLAYTVQALHEPGLSIGAFRFYIATDPSKVGAAWAGFQDIIGKVRAGTINPEELEGAKRYLVGAAKIGRQTVSSRTGQALLNSLYGLGLDHEEKHLAEIEKVTASEVRAAAGRFLAPDRGLLAVLGQMPEDFAPARRP